MANDLDEMTGPVNEAGRDVNVIEKQIPVKVGAGSLVFEIAWVSFLLIFLFMKIKGKLSQTVATKNSTRCFAD